MNTKKQLISYKKSLLNRGTANSRFIDYIETCAAREDENAKYSFHKVMVHNWSGNDAQLFDTMSKYFSTPVIPVMYSKSNITCFYTSSLTLLLKIIKHDFMFQFQRNMFNIDILFNEKNSVDCFHSKISIEDIVTGVVSKRMNEKFALDLSNFCNDSEFEEKKIHFYKLTLLSHFKILMLRIGRDAKFLNLSHNKLSRIPLDILNFFIKGDLIGIDLSNNQIKSITELARSSKIEKLWLEGNPLCEKLEPADYIKAAIQKFPRLTELDGMKINECGCKVPFFKDFSITPDMKTKMIVEKFILTFFTHYDCTPRKKTEKFYDPYAILTINTAYDVDEDQEMPGYSSHTRNFLDPTKRAWMEKAKYKRLYWKQGAAKRVQSFLPPTTHDPSTFSVDVLMHTDKVLILVVDGIFREKYTTATFNTDPQGEYRYYSFRRTFTLRIQQSQNSSDYIIISDIFTLRRANEEQIKSSFKTSIRNINELTLVNPDEDETDAIIKALMHITGLTKSEADARLRLQDWDIKKALKLFISDFKSNKISLDKMNEEDDFSVTSSLVDEVD